MEDHDVSNQICTGFAQVHLADLLSPNRYSEILDYHNVEAANIGQMEGQQYLGQ